MKITTVTFVILLAAVNLSAAAASGSNQYNDAYETYEEGSYNEESQHVSVEEDDTFREYIVHEVSGFSSRANGIDGDDDQDLEGEDDGLGPGVERYMLEEKWSSGEWPKYPLFIIILGGFRWDFLYGQEEKLASFRYLRRHGTHMPMVRPVFPPEDYPVWTSMATGKYPEDHNINGDIMFDLKSRRFFDRDDANSTHAPFWWQDAEPFWSTAAKYGKKVAMFNWHDCRLPGKQLEKPEDCRPYRKRPFGELQPMHEIAKQLDLAFTRLYKEGYDVAVVYTDVLRRVSETDGPRSPELKKVLGELDELLQATLIDIGAKDERAGIKMNTMVLSDYGMTATEDLTEIELDEYIDLDLIQYVIVSAGYAIVVPYVLDHRHILDSLQSIPDGVDVYLASQLQEPPIEDVQLFPETLHYRRGHFTQDILLAVKPSYQLVVNITDPKVICVPGSGDIEDEYMARVGYNPYWVEPPYPKQKLVKKKALTAEQIKMIKVWRQFHEHKDDMKVMGFGLGPDFKNGYTKYEVVEAVDFYQMFCFFLRIPSGEHSGSWDRIASMLTISAATVGTETRFFVIAIASSISLMIGNRLIL